MLYNVVKGIRRPHIVLLIVQKGATRPHIVLYNAVKGIKLTLCKLYDDKKLHIDTGRRFYANALSKFSFNLAKNCCVVR